MVSSAQTKRSGYAGFLGVPWSSDAARGEAGEAGPPTEGGKCTRRHKPLPQRFLWSKEGGRATDWPPMWTEQLVQRECRKEATTPAVQGMGDEGGSGELHQPLPAEDDGVEGERSADALRADALIAATHAAYESAVRGGDPGLPRDAVGAALRQLFPVRSCGCGWESSPAPHGEQLEDLLGDWKVARWRRKGAAEDRVSYMEFLQLAVFCADWGGETAFETALEDSADELGRVSAADLRAALAADGTQELTDEDVAELVAEQPAHAEGKILVDSVLALFGDLGGGDGAGSDDDDEE